MGVITLDPKNPQIVYVGTGDPEHAGGAGRGFGMLRSSDGGNTNGSSAAPLPDLPFNDVLVNPSNGHIYAAADFGIYMSVDDGATWSRIDNGLPGVSVYQLQIDSRDGSLLAGTYGRGVWRTIAP